MYVGTNGPNGSSNFYLIHIYNMNLGFRIWRVRFGGSLFCQQDLFRMKSKLFLLPGFWMGTEVPLGMLQDSSHHQDDHNFRLGDPNLNLYFPTKYPKVPGNLTFPEIPHEVS